MKIGFDAKRAFFNFRGLGNYSRTLIYSLTKYYPDDKYYLYSADFTDRESHKFKNKLPDKCIRIISPKSKLAKTFPSWWRSIFLSNRIKSDNIDIFHGLSHELPKGIHKLNLKSVVTIHDLIFLRYPEFFPLIDRIIYKNKLIYCTKVADIIIAICEQTKSDLVNFLNIDPNRIKVVYQSCDPRFYEIKDEVSLNLISNKYQLKEDGFILNVGAIEPRKNTLNLIKAFHLASNKTLMNLVLIGKGKAYLEEVKLYIKKHKLEKRVILLENVSQSELPYIYRLAKITVYPSLFEGFGIPIIESLFCETPVITSKGSCFPEAGGPGSLYIDPQDINDIAQSILRLEKDDELYSLLKREGLLYVQKFHHQNTSKVLNQVYAKLLSN